MIDYTQEHENLKKILWIKTYVAALFNASTGKDPEKIAKEAVLEFNQEFEAPNYSTDHFKGDNKS